MAQIDCLSWVLITLSVRRRSGNPDGSRTDSALTGRICAIETRNISRRCKLGKSHIFYRWPKVFEPFPIPASSPEPMCKLPRRWDFPPPAICAYTMLIRAVPQLELHANRLGSYYNTTEIWLFIGFKVDSGTLGHWYSSHTTGTDYILKYDPRETCRRFELNVNDR